MRVAFIGLGRMGAPMAANIRAAGHDLALYNRTRAVAERAASPGDQGADPPADAVRGAAIVVSMLADDAAIRAVTFGSNGILEGLGADGVESSLEGSLARDLVYVAANERGVCDVELGAIDVRARGRRGS